MNLITVNHWVTGSSPVGGANIIKDLDGNLGLFLCLKFTGGKVQAAFI